jgi:hypothetical protein
MAAEIGAEIGLIRLPRVETQPRQIVVVILRLYITAPTRFFQFRWPRKPKNLEGVARPSRFK